MSHSTPLQLTSPNGERGAIEHLNRLLKVSESLELSIEPLHQRYRSEFSPKLHQAAMIAKEGHRQDVDHRSSGLEPNQLHQVKHSDVKTGHHKHTSSSSIWNREGFTPLPSVLMADEERNDVFQPVQVEAESVQADVRVEMLEKLDSVDMSPGPVSEDSFVPIADRVKMNEKGSAEVLYTDPDSSIPQPLEALYDELSPGPQRLFESSELPQTASHPADPIVPLRLTPPPFDPELHAVVAPARLKPKRKSALPLVFLVALVCLTLGGLIAFTFLHDLASFVK